MIEFDNATNGGQADAVSLAFAHECQGDNRYLEVCVIGDTDVDDILSVTYNAVPLTFIGKITAGFISRAIYKYYLINPTIGLNTVIITANSLHRLFGLAVSYKNCRQTDQANPSDDDAIAAASITGTITTPVDNCWLSAFCYHNYTGSPLTGGLNTVSRISSDFDIGTVFNSDGPITPAGLASLIADDAGPNNLAIIINAIAPYEEPVVVQSGYMQTLSAGPSYTLVQNIKYALPPGVNMVQSLAVVEVSVDNSTYAALTGANTTGVNTAAKFIRSTTADNVVSVQRVR